MPDVAVTHAAFIRPGTSAYRRAVCGLCASGFATFALLYCVQPLLPVFSARFGVTAAASSLSLSLATLVMTVSIFAAGIASERFGRKRVMALSLFGSGGLNLLCAASPDWPTLLVLRTLEGVVAGGVPAVAMAYLAEEVLPAGLGTAMGVYVAGNALGGMLGRLLTGAIADVAGWRAAMAALSALGFAAAVAFLMLLPPSRNFRPAPARGPAYHAALFARLLRAPLLPWLLAFGFLIGGPFVTIYNYAGYRLVAPPYRLNQTEIGAIFLVYVFGIAGSTLFGRIADRAGRGPVLMVTSLLLGLGVVATLAAPVLAIMAGIALLTFGFFGAHAVASAWVARLGRDAKGHASALYLFSFYAGLSIVGSAGGGAWQRFGWPGISVMAGGLALLAFVVAVRLTRATRPAAGAA